MRRRFSQALLSSSVLGLGLGLGLQVQAATLYPGTTLLSDTPEFLDFQFNMSQVKLPAGTGARLPIIGPSVPLLIGQNWNVFASDSFALAPGIQFNVFVEQTGPSSGLASPQANFFGSILRGVNRPFPAARISYLTSAPAGIVTTETCPFGSTDCVSYEFGALAPGANCNVFGGLDPRFRECLAEQADPSIRIFELKGFFNSSGSPKPVPEGDTGIGVLAALGLMFWLRSRHNALKNTPKTLH
jgi:hypothetical protein